MNSGKEWLGGDAETSLSWTAVCDNCDDHNAIIIMHVQRAPDRAQAADRLRATMTSCLVQKALWKTTAKYKHGGLRRLNRKSRQHWCLSHNVMLTAWQAL